jgi:steroid delta-isomerase-like uncharacterized protein
MATEHDPTEFARRWNTAVFERQNVDAIEELVAEDFVGHDTALPKPMRGPEDVREQVEMVLTAFPDAQVELEATVAQGDRVAVRNSITGTHDGPYLGIEPTGEQVDVTAMAIQRIDDGQYVEEFQLVDRLSMLEQLGVVDPPTR